MLTIDIDNIIQYLLERGFLNHDSIVAGDLYVIDNSRRNRMIKIIRKRDASYIVKQPRSTDHQSKAIFILEAQIYDLLSNKAKTSYVKDIVPKFFGLDEQNNISIIQFLRNFETLNQLNYMRPQEEYQITIGKTLGNMLSVLHNTFTRTTIDFEKKLVDLPKKCPSFISFLSRPGPEILSNLSLGNIQLLKIVQQSKELSTFCEGLPERWRMETIIHGDLKADNILVKPLQTDNDNLKLQMKIVDWEFADFGDPAWDIGSVFHDFIRTWIYSLSVSMDYYYNNNQQHSESARYSIDNAKLAITTFWDTYSKNLSTNSSKVRELLLRSTEYCAIRLAQTSFESLYASSTLSNSAIFMLQTSENILKDLEKAIVHLLGIRSVT